MKNIVIFIHELLKRYAFSFQSFVVEKVLGNVLLEGYVPKYLQDLGKAKQNQVIVDNLKCGFSNHLKGQKTLPIVMAKDIVCALATSKKTCKSR